MKQGLVFSVLVVLILPLITLYVFQDGIIYTCGSQKQTYPPSAFGLPLPQIMNPTIYFERPGANRTIYFFHGNGISAENTYWHVGRLFQLCNCSIYLVEPVYCRRFRWIGYSGNYIINKLFMEVRYHVSETQENILYGVSLGTAHALHVFNEFKWRKRDFGFKKIILENPFTSISDLAPFYVPEWFIHTNWNNVAVINNIEKEKLPSVLILTSESDEIVPPQMSRRLGDLLGTKPVVFLGANHGNAGAHPDYLPTVEKFLSFILNP